MTHRRQDLRQARKGKDAHRWGDSLTPRYKKGRGPASYRPSKDSQCGSIKPSRKGEGLAALRSLSE